MQIEYSNKRGTVIFGGGSRNDFNMTAIEGLGPVEKRAEAASFYGQPGVETINISDGSRTITISGDLLKLNRKVYANALSVLNLPGVLTIIFSDGERRLIDVSYVNVTPGDECGAWQKYVIQFHCDYPYFRSSNERLVKSYEKVDHIDTEFTLPGVFTTESGNKAVNYQGNARCDESQIFIYVTENPNPELTQDEGSGISISNATTGESIRFTYTMQAGDVYTINIGKRKITNQNGTDLTRYISNDTFLDGFHLEPGENTIRTHNYQGTLNVEIMMFYTDYWIEAVY